MSFSILALGFLLGLRHALDADHLVAVATIVSEKRNITSSSLVGLFWGIGHTASLLLAGTVVLLIGLPIPERLGQTVEMGVALMLAAMGLRVLLKASSGGVLHSHPHRHGRYVHSHPHVHTGEKRTGGGGGDTTDAHRHSLAGSEVRGGVSLLVGVVHGLAGSAGLMLVVAATIPEFWTGVLYIVVFGIGSIGGMLLMSVVLSIPFLITAEKFQRLYRAVRLCVGSVSLGFGLFMCWNIVFVNELFR